ncbi:MAG: hypothetical protein ABFC34_15075 [Methanobacterium sp.]
MSLIDLIRNLLRTTLDCIRILFEGIQNILVLLLKMSNIGLIPIYYLIFSQNYVEISQLTQKEMIKRYIVLMVINMALLLAIISVTNFAHLITNFSEPMTLFSVTLSMILVYATLSLLSFTYVLTLNKKSDDYEEKSQMMRKSGELFFISTCVAIIGLSLIYAFEIIIKLFPDQNIITEPIPGWIILYFFAALLILIYSVIYFLFGLGIILKNIPKNLFSE